MRTANKLTWMTLLALCVFPAVVHAQTNTFCASNLPCTVTSPWIFNQGVNAGSPILPTGATPVISPISTWITANTTPVTVTNFLGGFADQTIQIICGTGDTFTSIASGAYISLASSPWTCSTSTPSITLTLIGTVWYETARAGGGGGGSITINGVTCTLSMSCNPFGTIGNGEVAFGNSSNQVQGASGFTYASGNLTIPGTLYGNVGDASHFESASLGSLTLYPASSYSFLAFNNAGGVTPGPPAPTSAGVYLCGYTPTSGATPPVCLLTGAAVIPLSGTSSFTVGSFGYPGNDLNAILTHLSGDTTSITVTVPTPSTLGNPGYVWSDINDSSVSDNLNFGSVPVHIFGTSGTSSTYTLSPDYYCKFLGNNNLSSPGWDGICIDLNPASSSGVSSFTGDGTLLSNSASTGTVTATLASTGVGYGVWGNTGSSSGAPGYHAMSSYPAAAFPTLNQSTTGNAATATGLASYPSLCTGSQFSQGLSSGSNNCATPSGSSGLTTIQLASNYTNSSSSSYTTVTDGTHSMSFTASANASYTMECHLYYEAASGGGLNVQFTGPSSPTSVVYDSNIYYSGGAPAGTVTGLSTAYSDPNGGQAVGTANHPYDSLTTLALQNGSNSGTVSLQVATVASSDTVTVLAGSYCRVYTQ